MQQNRPHPSPKYLRPGYDRIVQVIALENSNLLCLTASGRMWTKGPDSLPDRWTETSYPEGSIPPCSKQAEEEAEKAEPTWDEVAPQFKEGK